MIILNKKKTVDTLCDIEDAILASVSCESTSSCETCEHQQLCYFISDLRDEIFYGED